MKKILFVFFVFMCSASAIAQKEATRTFGTNTVVDPRFRATLNLIIPRYADTTMANIVGNIGNDSLGAFIQTWNDNKLWIRGKVGSSKRWYEVGGGSTLTEGSGISIIGNQIDLGGTLTKNTDLNFEDAGLNNRYTLKFTGPGGDYWTYYEQKRKTLNLGVYNNSTTYGASLFATDTGVASTNGNFYKEHSIGFENLIASGKTQFAILDSNAYRVKADSMSFTGGNVGIGTRNPTAQLHVTGSVKLTGLSGAAGVTTDSVVVVASDGTLKRRDAATFGGGGGSSYTFSSGLSESSGIVSIGTSTGVTTSAFSSTRRINEGGFGLQIYRDSGATVSAPPLHFKTGAPTGVPTEVMRIESKNEPGAPFSIWHTPSQNDDGSYNDVISLGFNPLQYNSTSKPGIRIGMERHWVHSGLTDREMHFEVDMANGTLSRLLSAKFSDYGTLAASTSVWDARGEIWSWSTVDNKNYASITSNRTADNTIFQFFTPNTTKGLSMTAATTGVDYSPVGLTGSNAALRLQTWQIVQLPYASFTQVSGGIVLSGDVFGNSINNIRDANYMTALKGNFRTGGFTRNVGTGMVGWGHSADLEVVAENATVGNMMVDFLKSDFSTHALRVFNGGEVNVGNGARDASAILNITSTTQGLLLPRMTKAQRDAIPSPATGLMIFQTDNTPGLRTYNGTNWMRYTETAD